MVVEASWLIGSDFMSVNQQKQIAGLNNFLQEKFLYLQELAVL